MASGGGRGRGDVTGVRTCILLLMNGRGSVHTSLGAAPLLHKIICVKTAFSPV